jgi:exopolyphosphatase/guanosine-5'-triphosphate,3'-diphosphate pyrophosphatase
MLERLWSRIDRPWRALNRPQQSRESQTTCERRTDVHTLRVACRRATAGLHAVGSLLPERPRARAVRILKRIRKAASEARDAEVHLALFRDLLVRDTDASGVLSAIDAITLSRDEAMGDLRRALPGSRRLELKHLFQRLADSLRDATRRGDLLSHQDTPSLRPLVERALRSALQLGSRPEAIHDLRVDLKRLRYALAVSPASGVHPHPDPTLAWLAECQRRFGDFHDVATLVQRLDELARHTPENDAARAELLQLRERFDVVRASREHAVISWWHDTNGAERLRSMQTNDLANPAYPQPARPPVRLNGDTPRADGIPQGNLFLAGKRQAVIDIGSNGIRLLAVELLDNASWCVLAEERATARLAQGMSAQPRLCAEAMVRATDIVLTFQRRCTDLGATPVAFATAAVRDATNRDEFLGLVRSRTGLDVRVLSARDEGRLTARAVARRFDTSHGRFAIADIGGGSLEVLMIDDGIITSNRSMRLGAVRMSERFGERGEFSRRAVRALTRHADDVLARRLPGVSEPPSVLVGCGGAFTTLLMLAAAQRGIVVERSSPRLREIGPVSYPEVRALTRAIARSALSERLRTPGLPADRADITPAGLIVIERLMRRLEVAHVRAHTGGVREGVLLEVIEGLASGDAPRHTSVHEDRDDAVRALLDRCRTDRAHARTVSRLSLQLYDALRAARLPAFSGDGEALDRELLGAAGLLHDIGIMVEYRAHHKHSRDIVRNADLPGFGAHERELLALLCRYHRRAEPCAHHGAFSVLSGPDRALVRRLAGVLRVADGLDRSHAGVVSGVFARRGEHGVEVHAYAHEDATTELRAARSKSGLLRRVLRCGVEVRARRIEPIVVMPHFTPDTAQARG